ncbi:MAG TPA: ABC transporter permease [Anaerolineales bacterium]|nr:ABC transporter permease [Anaerolineales bacterium]
MIQDPQGVWPVVRLTLIVSGAALAISAAIGIPIGTWLGLARFRGRAWVRAVIYTGMGLPPVVVGLAVYLLLSRKGPLGDLGWLFTPAAMVVAQIIIAFPIVAGLTSAALEALDPELSAQVRSVGANARQEALVLLRQARGGLLAALLAAFGGIISEVGAAMLVGGNIEGRTRVLSTAVVLETRRGNFATAMALGGTLLFLAFVINAALLRLNVSPRLRR